MRWITAGLAAIAGTAFAAFPLLRPWGDKTGDAADAVAAFAEPAWIAAWCLGLGAAAVLPYYGAETFGLHAIAQQPGLDAEQAVASATAIREGAVQTTVFGIGFLLVAAGGVAIAVDAWRRGALRWAGLLVAAGLAMYLPQFFLSNQARIAHGLLLGAAVVAWGIGSLRAPSQPVAAGAPEPLRASVVGTS